MNEKLFSMIGELGKALPDKEEGARLAMLAGNGLARPIMVLRGRQALMAASRARRSGEGGADKALRRVREAEAAAGMIHAMDFELARLSIVPPKSQPGFVGIYGHVIADGQPVKGAVVELRQKKNALVSGETDRQGAFALSVRSDETLTLAVRAGSMEQVDAQPLYGPVPMAPYRLVELAEAPGDDCKNDGGGRLIEDGRKKPHPEPAPGPSTDTKPTDPSRPGPGRFARLEGQTLNVAAKELAAEELLIGKVVLLEGDRPTPVVASVSDLGDGRLVGLEISVRNQPAAHLDVFAVLLAQQSVAKGTDFQAATTVRAWLRKMQLSSLDEVRKVATLSEARFAKWAGETDRDQARQKLAATQGALKLMDAV